MLIAARAIGYESMKSLVLNQPELLSKNSFISIIPPELRTKQEAAFVWPENSDRWLSTFFEDIRPEHLSILPSLEEEFGRQFALFDTEQADQIIDFLKKCQQRNEPETLYVNCMAGVSRSGAITSFACQVFGMNKGEFLQSNPQIDPNKHVLYLLRERWDYAEHSDKAKSAFV